MTLKMFLQVILTYQFLLILNKSSAIYHSDDSYYKYDEEASTAASSMKWPSDGFLGRLRRQPESSPGSLKEVREALDALEELKKVMPPGIANELNGAEETSRLPVLKRSRPEVDQKATTKRADTDYRTGTIPTTRESGPTIYDDDDDDSDSTTGAVQSTLPAVTDEIRATIAEILTKFGTITNSPERRQDLLKTIRESLNMAVPVYDDEPNITAVQKATRSKGIQLYDKLVPGNISAYLDGSFFPEYDPLKELKDIDRLESTVSARDPGRQGYDEPDPNTLPLIRTHRRRTTTTRTRRSRTTPIRIDIAKLMALVSNMTMLYGDNLALLLNQSLEKYTIPTCPTPTTTTTTPETTTDLYANLTGTIMGKCFVCGLDDERMPFNAHCADAFSGDFLPLIPMNPTARGHIASFRKYCRWMNIPRFYINSSDSRAMWGRWTGGCSVRWIDVSGMYTQRTCRNRHRAIMGRHYLSKRMAKLEMALQHIDNGCIISPMASLVPFSRGVSLYARFHACVCTGNWCNKAVRIKQWTANGAVLMFLLFYGCYRDIY